MKVRKPGRPLTACPHLQSQPCDCPKSKGCGCSNSITVAFPKRQGCGDCKTGPKTIVKTEGKSSGPAIPDVPAATAGTFRVAKKPASLTAGVPKPRPQSYDETYFNAIGIGFDSCNIIQNGYPATPATANGMGMNGMAPLQAPVHIAPALPNLYSQNSHPMPLPFFNTGMMPNAQTPRTSISDGAGLPFATADSEVAGFSLSNGSYMNGNSNYMPNGPYVANGHPPQPILTSPYPTAMSTPQSYSSSVNGTTPAKSCCSSKKSTNSSPDDLGMNPMSQVPLQQPYNAPTFSNGNGNIYSAAGLQPTYTYANSFAVSPQQMPIGQWSQNFGMNYSPQQPLQQLQASNGMFPVPASVLNGNYEMQCNCGSDCECFGCQVHPQNATTLAEVRNLHNQMSHAPSSRNSATASPITPMQPQDSFYMAQNQSQPQIFQRHLLQDFYDKDPLVTATTTAIKSETPESSNSRRESLQLSLNGSPYDSMGETQPVFDDSNYFMVQYDMEGGCGGDLEGCQCGDDCQCIGCAIHQEEQERRQFEPEQEQQQESGVVKAESGMVTPQDIGVKKSCCG